MIDSLDHLVLTVRNIAATVAFYEQALGMRHVRFTTADGQVRSALAFGRQKINLHQAGHEFDPKARHPTPGSGDLCFLTRRPLDEVAEHLRQRQIAVIEGPVRRTGATGPLLSLYVRDPDGNLIEIANALAAG